MAPRMRLVSLVRSRAPADSVSVGGVVAPLRTPIGPGLLRSALSPNGFLACLPDSLRPSLQWMAQKDALGQDMLLLTSPAERLRARLLALAYAELVHAELEYLAVSADTTEADLKQRREIRPGGNVSFSDSPPVRAAVGGGMLVLDGLERAERNVLPTINNLLENREMSLDDGRFLIERRRYDSIKESSSAVGGPAVAKLQPVHPRFRVIALSSPSPPFDGRALDPPLRSRFQAWLVPPACPEELAEELRALPSDTARDLVVASETIAELERRSARHDGLSGFFSFSSTALSRYCSAPATDAVRPFDVLKRVYPPLHQVGFGKQAGRDGVNQALAKLGIAERFEAVDAEDGNGVLVNGHFRTPRIETVLAGITADLAVGHNVLLLGLRGSGKSALVRSLQNSKWRTFAMHRDLSGRDLLQRRITDQLSGASSWADQPSAAAARAGGLVVLDGVHRLPKGALVAALGRACAEREMDLPDGTRLVDAARLDGLAPSDCVQPLQPGFRVVALGEPGEWLTPEIASMFSTHVLPELTPLELKHALRELVPAASPQLCQRICDVAVVAMAAQSNDSISASERTSLRISMRVLMRMMRRAISLELRADDARLGDLLHDALMSRFLPPRLQDVVDGWLRVSGVWTRKHKRSEAVDAPEIVVGESAIRADGRSLPRRVATRPELVPAPRDFFGSPAALRAIAAIMNCEHAGEKSVLLLGNQGVGKNVAVDRVLQLLGAEREYVQLHRDTTVSSLTVLPVLEEGRLRYEDAPLVRAAKHGRVCVLDEADKAPTEVVVILKALMEDGELVLGDGRRLLGGSALRAAEHAAQTAGEAFPQDVIPVHDDFRLWVLANRPGFPFHGNAFFRDCGDVFAAIALDNPDVESETALLEHVAPTYPHRGELHKLARAFSELRALAENGAIAYPYSMREAVAVARHLEKYPSDSIANALANVLAFEAFDAPLRRQLADIFEANGFQGVAAGLEERFSVASSEDGVSRTSTSRGTSLEIQYLSLSGEGGASTPRTGLDGPKHGEVDPTGAPHVGGNRWAGGSGGSDTAGLGGRGGPYRLWDGNPVYQVSDEAKAEVSEEAKAKARALAQQAWRERLAEIEKMDDRMWAMYNRVFGEVEPQIAQLQAILQQAKDKRRERVWLRNRSDGELDDTRLVEGIAGDRFVFKRRGRAEASHRADQEQEGRKRRICFVMDCSGSMYRFNGMDGRLNRMLEVTCLILEGMEGYLDRYEYAVLGHSGETDKIEFVDFGRSPANRGERLRILQKMVAHTQFCMPGDNTIEATNTAIDHVLSAMAGDPSNAEDDDDEVADKGRAFVVVLSDANFRRYQMDPLWWSEALMRDPRVEGHAVMIGSLGAEAKHIQASLPPGRGHIVLDTALLPATFKSIFEQAGLFSDVL